MHNLAANTDKRNFEDLLKKTAEAIFMAKCLKFNGFFGDPRNPPPEMSRAIVFVSSLLLRYSSSGQPKVFLPLDVESSLSGVQRIVSAFASNCTSQLPRHLQIAATNGLEMAECILKNNDITKFDIIPVGGAIFPTMSFFNHSCYPNATRLGFQNHQV